MTAYRVLAPVAGRPGLVGGALRPATAADAPAIHALVTKYQEAGRLLPRTIEEIARHADRFLVISDGGAGAGDVLGCAELAPLSGGVAEVRSLVVDESARGLGFGRLVAEDTYWGYTEAERNGGALVVAAGYELYHGERFALDLSLRLAGLRYSHDQKGSNASFTVGFHWFQ